MHPLAKTRFQENMTPTQANSNASQGASGFGVGLATNQFHFFSVDQEYNGESFAAGDFLFGDNSTGEENLAYKSGTLRVRVGTTNIVTFGSTGIRIVNGGLAIKQTNLEITNGTIDLDQDSDTITSSYLNITVSTGNFSINSLAVPINPNHVLFLKNATLNNMTLVSSGSPPSADYWPIITQDGADKVSTGIGTALLIGDETFERWELISFLG
jgi:hypothetical protein